MFCCTLFLHVRVCLLGPPETSGPHTAFRRYHTLGWQTRLLCSISACVCVSKHRCPYKVEVHIDEAAHQAATHEANTKGRTHVHGIGENSAAARHNLGIIVISWQQSSILGSTPPCSKHDLHKRHQQKTYLWGHNPCRMYRHLRATAASQHRIQSVTVEIACELGLNPAPVPSDASYLLKTNLRPICHY